MDGLEHEDIALPKPGFGLDPRHWLGTQEIPGARRPGTSHRMAQERLHIRCMYVYIYGYGSIPINTIFSGMNIHLPAILGFTRYQGFDQ